MELTPIWISLKTATTATVIAFFCGIFVAKWMLNYRGKFKEVIESILTAPLVLPPTVVGFLLLVLLGKNGFIGRILEVFNLRFVFSWYATVIASTVVAFPLMYKTALGALKQIDSDLFAAARTLGASEDKIFWHIAIPLAKPGIVAGTLLSFARALGEFGATVMLAGAIPGKTETIPIAIFFAAESGEMDRALWLVITMLVISLGVITTVNYSLGNTSYTDIHKSNFIRDKFQTANNLLKNLLRKLLEVAANIVPQQNLLQANNIIASSIQPFLLVDIQKRLPDFTLDITLQTDCQPLGLLGASGAGKSVLLRCIAGIENPDCGRIVLNGKVLFDSQQGINIPPQQRNCGFLLQNYALFPHLTVAQNIAFGMSKVRSLKEMYREITQQLISVDLVGLGDRYPRELSGGQKQRVALARATASNPDIMLLDEPFSALDTYLRHKQEKILRQNLTRHRGITLFVTHNLEEAYRVCTNLAIIDRGKAIARGTKQEIFNNPGNYRTAQVTNCKNFSRIAITNDSTVRAIDWNCNLTVGKPILKSHQYIGIRAHQLLFPETAETFNTFPCWLAATSETQHRITLYLKLNQPNHSAEDYHLQAEVFQEKWQLLKVRPFPWNIYLKPSRIMLLER